MSRVNQKKIFCKWIHELFHNDINKTIQTAEILIYTYACKTRSQFWTCHDSSEVTWHMQNCDLVWSYLFWWKQRFSTICIYECINTWHGSRALNKSAFLLPVTLFYLLSIYHADFATKNLHATPQGWPVRGRYGVFLFKVRDITVTS